MILEATYKMDILTRWKSRCTFFCDEGNYTYMCIDNKKYLLQISFKAPSFGRLQVTNVYQAAKTQLHLRFNFQEQKYIKIKSYIIKDCITKEIKIRYCFELVMNLDCICLFNPHFWPKKGSKS